MKRLICMLLAAAALLALGACGRQPEAAAPAAAPAAGSAPLAEPDAVTTVSAAVLLDRVGAAVRTYDLGESVRVEREDDGFYRLSDGLLVEKWLVRLDTEAVPAERTAYVRRAGDTPLYGSPYCEGEPILTLSGNQRLSVLDEFGLVLRVRAEVERSGAEAASVEGYLHADDVVGGSAGAYPGRGGAADGGEISLTSARRSLGRAAAVPLSAGGSEGETRAFVGGPGRVLAKGTEGYARVFRRGDEVKVMEKGEELCTLLLDDGRTALIPTKLLVFGDGEATEPRTGYAQANAPFWRSWRTGVEEPEKLSMNTALAVLGSFGELLIVEKDDGTLGLTEADMLSPKQIVYSYDGGGSSGGGGESADWTAPVM